MDEQIDILEDPEDRVVMFQEAWLNQY